MEDRNHADRPRWTTPAAILISAFAVAAPLTYTIYNDARQAKFNRETIAYQSRADRVAQREQAKKELHLEAVKLVMAEPTPAAMLAKARAIATLYPELNTDTDFVAAIDELAQSLRRMAQAPQP